MITAASTFCFNCASSTRVRRRSAASRFDSGSSSMRLTSSSTGVAPKLFRTPLSCRLATHLSPSGVRLYRSCCPPQRAKLRKCGTPCGRGLDHLTSLGGRFRADDRVKLAGAAGFEPANAGTKNRCLTTWRRPSRRSHVRERRGLYPARRDLEGEMGCLQQLRYRALMTEPGIRDFHAHLYYDAEEVEQAKQLAAAAQARFPVAVGHFHLRPVGPHPRGSCQLTVPTSLFGDLAQWLVLNRWPLTILANANIVEYIAIHSLHI